MFVESLGSATFHNGIIRIECRMRGGAGQDQVTGQLVIPAMTAVQVAQQLGAILNEMGRRLDEARKQGTTGKDETKPAEASKDQGKDGDKAKTKA